MIKKRWLKEDVLLKITGVFVMLLLLRAEATFAQPDESHRTFREDDLVELVNLDSTLRLDIRYATTNNFMKRRMYSQARAFLHRPAAKALLRVHEKARRHGFGLLIFDAYRPWSVTKEFWDASPPSERIYVADPAVGSKHNRGSAVDLSFYSLKSGREVRMPSEYDDFTKRSSPKYKGGTAEQRRLRDLLRTLMESEGFTVNPGEWWHFDYKNWREYRILDIPFEGL